jgi:hypothetical protein
MWIIYISTEPHYVKRITYNPKFHNYQLGSYRILTNFTRLVTAIRPGGEQRFRAAMKLLYITKKIQPQQKVEDIFPIQILGLETRWS